MTLRLEATGILERRSYLKSIAWLPRAYFVTPKDMQKILGFEPAYESLPAGQNFFFANLDMQKPLDINGYDVLLQANSYRGMDPKIPATYDFAVRGANYKLVVESLSPLESRVSVRNATGTELVGTGLYDFADLDHRHQHWAQRCSDAEEMTDAAGNGCKRMIFQNINITYGTGADAGRIAVCSS